MHGGEGDERTVHLLQGNVKIILSYGPPGTKEDMIFTSTKFSKSSLLFGDKNT